jgi:hypothetical protein
VKRAIALVLLLTGCSKGACRSAHEDETFLHACATMCAGRLAKADVENGVCQCVTEAK